MVVWWGADLYRLCIYRCRCIYRVGWLLVGFLIMHRWSGVIYSYYREFVVLYSLDMRGLAIYRVGGVGICDILGGAGVSTGAALVCGSVETYSSAVWGRAAEVHGGSP